jgi:DNA-binding response OmpR family regulator
LSLHEFICGNTRLCFASPPATSTLIAQASTHLTPREALLANILWVNQDCVITRSELMDHIYNQPDPPFEKALDLLLHRLRKKLTTIGSDVTIDSRHGIGWHLLANPSVMHEGLA